MVRMTLSLRRLMVRLVGLMERRKMTTGLYEVLLVRVNDPLQSRRRHEL